MEIVENSYYDHVEHGLVKVISVNNGVVSMQKEEDEVMAMAKKIPGGAKQSAAGFRADAKPADISVDAEAAVFNIRGLNNE